MKESIFQKLENLKEQLDEFYSVEQVEFISNQNEAIIRDLVYIKNPSDLILHIIKERGINPCVGFVQVSLDGGGGFLKVVVNVFEEQESENKYMNSGVQKVLIIAIVEDIPEKYENLRLVLEKLSLEDVNYYIAFDLKCTNVLFGLSSHAGKKACLWCSGECTLDKGTLRTIDNINSCYEAYIKNGSIRSSMKAFDSTVNKRPIYLNTDKNTVLENLVAPPELHLLIGAVDKIAGFLLTEWDGFDLWLKKHYMIKRGYHGVGWDANNANKILKLIDELQLEVQLKVPYLLPVTQCLRTFKSVKEACFGRNLDSDSEHKISLFKNAFLCLQETAFSLGKTLTVSWKIHIICSHVFPSVKHAGCGLSKYAEQCGVAIHAKFKPTWQRYKCNIDHKDYGDRLKTAVVDFGIKRL